MKKSSKRIPKSHLPKYFPGGRTDDIRPSVDNSMYGSPESEGSMMGTTQDMGGGTQNIYNQNRAKSNMLGTNQKLTGNQYAQMGQAVAQGGMQAYQTSQTPGLSEYEKNQQYGESIKSAEQGVVSAINPIFGMIHSGVTAATAPLTAKATQTDEQGNLKNKNFAKADIIGQGFADPMAMIPTMISNKFSMKKYINSVEDNAKGKIAAQKAQEDAYAQQQTDYQNQQQSMMDAAFARGFANQNQTGGNTYVQYAKYGGQMKYAMRGMNMQPNAEIEKQENVVAPNGGFLQANGPTHENGGVPVALPGNSMVFSDRLKLGKKTFAELNKVNNTNKEDKILESNKFGNTSKRTAELMKFAKNKNSEELFGAQEALKQAKVEAYAKKMGVTLPQTQEAPEEGMQFAMGGLKQYGPGGPVDNTRFTPGERQQAYADSMTLYKSGFNKNIPNWQAEPGFNEAALRLNKLNGTPPESTDKSPIASDYNYLQNRSVPYAKPTFPGVQYKKEVSPLKQSYPMERLPLKDLNNPVDINPQFQSVPTNRPNTIKTQIQTGPNMSYKEYKQGNEVLDRAYFDPSTKKEINIEGFAMGGRKLPKYGNGVKFVPKMASEDQDADIVVPGSTVKSNPDFTEVLGPDSYNTFGKPLDTWEAARLNKSTWDADYLNNPNAARPVNTDENNKTDWQGIAANIGMGLANNAGNIYNLSRYNKPEVEKYERMKATFLDPSAALRDAEAQTRRAEYNVRGASGGNAGTYLSNRVALNAQNTINKARIHTDYQNANAGISNSVGQYNNELARQEVIANAQNRARNRSGKGEAIGSMGSNIANQMMDNKKTNMDQETLQLMMKYYDTPEFQRIMKEYKGKK